jgi:hypothetical protein
MSIAMQIKNELNLPTFTVQAYLQDLSDADLMRRPVDNANHIAWQLGHLIDAENKLNNMVCPGSMPALSDGFAEKHRKENASSDDPSQFCTKDEYLKAMIPASPQTVDDVWLDSQCGFPGALSIDWTESSRSEWRIGFRLVWNTRATG